MAVMSPALGDVIEAQLIGSLAGQTTRNVMHFYVGATAGAEVDFATWAANFDAQLRAVGKIFDRIRQFAPSNLDMSTRTYQIISPVRQVKATIFSAYTGANITQAVTANVAGVVTKRGDLANRQNIGSLHVVAPGPTGAATNGTFDAPTQTLLNAIALTLPLAIAFTSTTVTKTMVPAIYHRATHSYSDITSGTGRTTVRVMRRRTVGVGE